MQKDRRRGIACRRTVRQRDMELGIAMRKVRCYPAYFRTDGYVNRLTMLLALDFSIESIDLGLEYLSLLFVGLYFLIKRLYAFPVSFNSLCFLGVWR